MCGVLYWSSSANPCMYIYTWLQFLVVVVWRWCERINLLMVLWLEECLGCTLRYDLPAMLYRMCGFCVALLSTPNCFACFMYELLSLGLCLRMWLRKMSGWSPHVFIYECSLWERLDPWCTLFILDWDYDLVCRVKVLWALRTSVVMSF